MCKCNLKSASLLFLLLFYLCIFGVDFLSAEQYPESSNNINLLDYYEIRNLSLIKNKLADEKFLQKIITEKILDFFSNGDNLSDKNGYLGIDITKPVSLGIFNYSDNKTIDIFLKFTVSDFRKFKSIIESNKVNYSIIQKTEKIFLLLNNNYKSSYDNSYYFVKNNNEIIILFDYFSKAIWKFLVKDYNKSEVRINRNSTILNILRKYKNKYSESINEFLSNKDNIIFYSVQGTGFLDSLIKGSYKDILLKGITGNNKSKTLSVLNLVDSKLEFDKYFPEPKKKNTIGTQSAKNINLKSDLTKFISKNADTFFYSKIVKQKILDLIKRYFYNKPGIIYYFKNIIEILDTETLIYVNYIDDLNLDSIKENFTDKNVISLFIRKNLQINLMLKVENRGKLESNLKELAESYPDNLKLIFKTKCNTIYYRDSNFDGFLFFKYVKYKNFTYIILTNYDIADKKLTANHLEENNFIKNKIFVSNIDETHDINSLFYINIQRLITKIISKDKNSLSAGDYEIISYIKDKIKYALGYATDYKKDILIKYILSFE